MKPDMSGFVVAKQDHVAHLIIGGNLNFIWFVSLFYFILYICVEFLSKRKDKRRWEKIDAE